MVKIAKIGSGCLVKSVCDLDREIAEVKSKTEGKDVKPEGSCHFSFGKFDLYKNRSYVGKFICNISGELFSEVEDYEIRPENPPGKNRKLFQFNSFINSSRPFTAFADALSNREL